MVSQHSKERRRTNISYGMVSQHSEAMELIKLFCTLKDYLVYRSSSSSSSYDYSRYISCRIAISIVDLDIPESRFFSSHVSIRMLFQSLRILFARVVYRCYKGAGERWRMSEVDHISFIWAWGDLWSANSGLYGLQIRETVAYILFLKSRLEYRLNRVIRTCCPFIGQCPIPLRPQ